MKFLKVAPRPDYPIFLRDQAGYDPGYEEPGKEYVARGEIIQITEAQADKLYDAGKELYQMCLAAVDHVIKSDRFAEFGIGPEQAQLITDSWTRSPMPDGTTRDPELYARFDLSWDGGDNIKFLEINGDTPVTAYECSTVQWMMMKDLVTRGELPEGTSQFNTLEEEIVKRLKHLYNAASQAELTDTLHFAAVTDSHEDLCVVSYLEELAKQAGWKTKYIDTAHIGVETHPENPKFGALIDNDGDEIKALYKLMPWEHVFEGDQVNTIAQGRVAMIEPAWRALMSNKMLSVVLWEMFPNHPYLLAAYKTPEKLGGTYVEKPIFGREGSGINIIFNGQVMNNGDTKTQGHNLNYGDHYPKIYQEYTKLHVPEGGPKHGIVTGLWVVGEEPCGMDMRYDDSPITGRKNVRFLPHCMTPHAA